MEFVLVVERARLFDLSFPQGFVAAARDRAAAADRLARIRRHAFFVERRKAEQDSSWKQIIPYVVVTRGDSLLLLERTKRQGEARLHGKLSIGVGGHINPIDGDGAVADVDVDVLDAGCRRELEEEIAIRSPYTLQAVGVINDDASDVGSVHFGLVNVARCETADVSIRESELLEGSFVTRAALAELARTERGRLETWSALIIERLDAALDSAG
jgi:predicted NUDIX family phosphoesterase